MRAMKRITTPLSAKALDEWALRTIGNSLGANLKIEYTPDFYSYAGLGTSSAFIIKNIVTGTNSLTITLNNPTAIDIGSIYHLGQVVQGVFIRPKSIVSGMDVTEENYYTTNWNKYNLVVTDISSTSNTITVSCPPDLISTTEAGFNLGAPLAGSIFFDYTGSQNIYGGGVRVSKISVKDENNTIHNSLYNYDIPNHAGTTSERAL